MKLKVSRPSQKKNFFPLQFDNTTTMGFGFVQPLTCTELVPQTSVDLSCASFVRLAPLATPTYGRCNLHHYTCFVPASEVFHPWDSFLSSTSFNGGGSSYVPTSVPYSPSRFLLLNVLLFSTCSVFRRPAGQASHVWERFKPFTSDEIKSANQILLKSLGFEVSNQIENYMRSVFTEGFYYTHNVGDDFDKIKDGLDYTTFTSFGDYDYVFCWRFSDYSRNLRSILIGLGYQLLCTSTCLSVLPLFAYYRAYFDLFYPKRFLSYKDSSLHKLIERVEYDNITSLYQLALNAPSVVSDFFKDLVDCYYTSDSDYVSLHHSGVSTNPITQAVSTLRPNNGLQDISAAVDEQASLPQSIDSKNIGSVQLRVLRWLTKYVNKRTYLGGKIDEILRSQYDSASECGDSFLIDSFVTPIEISDVMNQAGTAQEHLGEYAGKGIGFSSPRSAKYRAKEFGFLIHFAAVVPQSGYAQAIDPCLGHIKKFDYYTPGLDGLTLVPTRKLFIFGTFDCSSSDLDTECNKSFGNIPIYSEYKHKYSILNGDISQPSTRSSYLPYTLDKLLPYVDPFPADTNSSLVYSSIVNGTLWRYVGFKRWLGMYNRIFVDSGTIENEPFEIFLITHFDGYKRLDDNFIVHNHFKLSMRAPMLSFGSSFDTGADDLGSESQISSSGE